MFHFPVSQPTYIRNLKYRIVPNTGVGVGGSEDKEGGEEGKEWKMGERGEGEEGGGWGGEKTSGCRVF